MPSVCGGVYRPMVRLGIVTAAWVCLIIVLTAAMGALGRSTEAQNGVRRPSLSNVTNSPTPVPVGESKGCSETPEANTAPTSPAPTSSPTPDPNKPWEFIRLPTSVLPRHYVITLNPNFYTKEDLDFTGTVEIEIEVLQPTKYILIHIDKINITCHSLTTNDTNEEVETGEPFEFSRNQFWVLPISSTSLSNGFYRLKIEYTGSLDGMTGFYRSGYLIPETNETRYLVSTQFEPVDARKAFPCFDEPQMKAQFTINMIHKSTDGYFALSNMPQKSTVPYKVTGYNITSFERSVTMSTYLVCFVVCDFTYVEGRSNGNKPFRVFAPKHKKNQINYALSVGIKIQNYFENYFNLSYTLPKQDMIVIPNFYFGAMENWGLITYRETALLYNETLHSFINKFRVTRVIAHELAHMWFGNIVTMAWWDDLWLNEGFASFISYKGIKIAQPTWDTDALARLYATRVAFPIDDVITSHPIIVEVNTPEEFMESFDKVTYRKGQAILLMLEGLMGENNFRLGIQAYMKQFKFKNARTSQLWETLSQLTNLPLSAIMNTWTLQMGFPLISISNAKPPVAMQKWYLLDPTSRPNAPKSPYGYLWRVRLDYKTNGSPRQGAVWLNQTKSVTIQNNIDLSRSSSWILFNIGADGFYRVNYPTNLWKRFPSMIMAKTLPTSPDERVALVDDVMYLARSGEVSYDVAMPMLKILEREHEYPVWIRASAGLSFLMRMTGGLPIYAKMRKFVQGLTANVYNRMNFTFAKSHQQALLRTAVVDLACSSGLPACRVGMLRLFNKWKNGAKIPLEIRTFILQYGLESSDTPATWEMMWRRYERSDSDVEKNSIINALASTRHPWLIVRLLSHAMNESLIKRQDFFGTTSCISRKQVGRLVLWTWFRENWTALVKRFTLKNRGLGRMILAIAPTFNMEVQLNEMKAFFARYPKAGAGERARKKSLSLVEANLRWIQTNEATLSAWLNANVHR